MSEDRKFDVRKLIALVRQGDPAAVRQAYAVTFGSELGRFVLLHHLAECGVAQTQGRGTTASDRDYAAGMHDAALQLAALAGFDQTAAAAVVLTDELTEENHDDTQFEGSALAGFTPDHDDEF